MKSFAEFEGEHFHDFMGITRHTGDPWLDKILNRHICYKGGGKGGKSKSGGTQIQKSEPWDGVKDYLTGGGGKPIYEWIDDPNASGKGPQRRRVQVGTSGGKIGLYPEAEALYKSGKENIYEGDVAAGPNQIQQDAIDERVRLAQQGNSIVPAALRQQEDVISGKYLDGSKFLDAYGSDIFDAVDGRFGTSGRSGSGYHSATATKELGDAASKIYFGERGAQDAAVRNAPGLAEARYLDSDALSQAGMQQGMFDQSALDAAFANHYSDQNQHQKLLDDYARIINSANVPASSTTTQQGGNGSNGLLGALGTAATLASFWPGKSTPVGWLA